MKKWETLSPPKKEALGARFWKISQGSPDCPSSSPEDGARASQWWPHFLHVLSLNADDPPNPRVQAADSASQAQRVPLSFALECTQGVINRTEDGSWHFHKYSISKLLNFIEARSWERTMFKSITYILQVILCYLK